MLGLTDSSIFYENLKQRLSERIGISADVIESLGLLDESLVVKLNTPLDTLSHYLSKRLAFGKGTSHIGELQPCFLIKFIFIRECRGK